MDSGVVQSRVHESNQHHPHNIGLKQGEHYGADEPHHDPEKKSVLKKVKAKAKKIKDTIKKHAHHDHDQEQHDIPDDHDLDEEEDEEMAENPEVHGAPIYDSTVPRTVIPSEQVHHHQEPKVVVVSPGTGPDQKVANDSAARTFTGEEGNTGQQKVNVQKPIDLQEDPAAPGTRRPHTASNYQSKVTDPTGAGDSEIQVTPVVKSFAEMNVNDGTKPYPEPHVRSTATNQYPSATPVLYEEQKHYESVGQPWIENSHTVTQSPSGTPIVHEEQKLHESVDKPPIQSSYTAAQSPSATSIVHEEQKLHESVAKPPIQSSYTETRSPSGTPIAHEEQKLYESVNKPLNQSGDTATQYPSGTSEMDVDQNRFDSLENPSNQSRYTDKIWSATSAVADKDVTTKNTVASKLGNDDNKGNRDYEKEQQRRGENQSSYTDKISSATSAVDDKAVTAKNTVASKLGYDDNKGNRDYENEQQRRGENQSSYTDKISSATSAVAGKAVSAENVVTSKLGYGDNKADRDNEKESHGENQTSYTEKISSAPSANADEAVSAKNVVASKLSYDDNKVDRDNEKEASHGENQSGYTDKISYATSAIADKAVSAKNAVTSKLGYGENKADRDNEKEPSLGENQTSYTQKLSSAPYAIADKAVSAKNAVTSKLGYGDNKANREHEKETKPGENQRSYTEKISSATSAITNKAVSAKNAVTSKLGYNSGGGDDDNVRTTHEDHPKTEDANATTAEYGKKITESLTEKLSPVYGKVAGVGSAVKSKLSPASTNETDKGVSMKDYLAEKLRPGEEDRALSEVITEALHKRGGGGQATAAKESGGDQEGRKITDVISDVIHDRDEVFEETEHRPLGKVTESEEVKRRLGGETEIERKYEESYENSSGKGVVEKLKDAAGSWFGTSSKENQSSSQDTDGRRLQESSN